MPTADSRIFAQVARLERDAALQALAGRLAHQMRNPLAAIRAACSGLRDELDDIEQRETLDLILHEVDRLLQFVSGTVRDASLAAEPPTAIDIGAETELLLKLLRLTGDRHVQFDAAGVEALRCSLPRAGFRAVLFGLLNSLDEWAVGDARLSLARQDACAEIRLEFEAGLHRTSASSAMSQLNLQLAERFARDVGGNLQRIEVGQGASAIVLSLPCADD